MTTPLVFDRLPVPDDSPITTRFGEVFTLDDGIQRTHRGVDFGVPEGTPVTAPAAGWIVDFTNDGSFGLAVCIDHPGTPWYSLYAHLSRIDVAVGQWVGPGFQLGKSGNTGLSSGPHLHWQVCDTKTFPPDITRSADPLSFLAPLPAQPEPPGNPPGAGALPPAPVPAGPDFAVMNDALQQRFELIRIALHPDLTIVTRALNAARGAIQ